MAGRLRNLLRMVRSFAILGRALAAGRPVRPKALDERLAALPADGLPLERPVAIRWNEHHVPWIEADSDRDCAVALGAVHAHLRLGQMEVMRRIALGRTAEMFGPAAIDADRLLRTLGLTQAVPGILAMQPERTKVWLDGFVAGVNHVLARLDELPPEFDLLALAREPWTPADVMALGRLAAADVNWLVWFRLWQARRAPEWSALWEKALAHGAGGPGDLPRALLAAARHGSNAWAVAARKSTTGGALLACDPHLPVTLPNAWVLAAYRSPSFQVCGLMLPGLPFVAVGRNPWLAWGGTALHAASSDLFDLSSAPGERFETRTEVIKVRGGAPVTAEIRSSRYGPILSDAMDMGGAYALRWVGHEPSDELSAMLGINAARTFDEFRTAADRLAVPGQTFVVAEATGGVFSQIAARLPRRPRDARGDPVRRAEALRHWRDFVTASHFPARRNPSCGFIVSANDRPDDTPVPVGFLFSPAVRRERITSMLAASQAISPALMQEMQRDVTLPGACALRDRLLALVGPQGAPAPTVAALRDWNGTYGEDSRGALAFELLIAHFRRRHYSRAERAFHTALWAARDMIAADLSKDGTDFAAALTYALRKTDKDLRCYRTWGDIHRLVLGHPLGALPLAGRRLVFADLPSAGGSDTVMKTAAPFVPYRHTIAFGSVARLTADLSGPDETRAVLLGGQDGWLGSSTMLDQLRLWREGRAIRLPLTPGTARREFPRVTWLTPAEDQPPP